MFAGYETSASSLVFLAYNLANNPDAMRRLLEEIDSTFPNKVDGILLLLVIISVRRREPV